MQFYTRKRRNLFVNVVSLIDILAILLIFFIVTTTFRKKQPQVQINLPDSKEAETSSAPSTEPVVLRVKTPIKSPSTTNPSPSTNSPPPSNPPAKPNPSAASPCKPTAKPPSASS